MRRRRMGYQVALLLGLGVAAPALAGDPAADPPPQAYWRSTTIWDSLSLTGKPAPPQKAKDKDKDRDKDKEKDKDNEQHARDREAPKKAAPLRQNTPADDAAAEREREEKAYLRRLAVCLKLHEIAEATKDEDLEQKARQLDERIWSVYSQRTNRPPSEDGLEVDETVLQKHLTAGSARAPMPSSPTHSVSGRDRASRTPAEEDRP